MINLQHINTAEFEAILKGINLPVNSKQKCYIQHSNCCIQHPLTGKAMSKPKATSEILIRSWVNPISALINMYNPVDISMVNFKQNLGDQLLKVATKTDQYSE